MDPGRGPCRAQHRRVLQLPLLAWLHDVVVRAAFSLETASLSRILGFISISANPSGHQTARIFRVAEDLSPNSCGSLFDSRLGSVN